MKAMILAAGLGKRMRPLTDHLPKPLLAVAGKTLIEYQIERLVAAGVVDIVINISYLAEKIRAHLGDGSRYGAKLHYSEEEQPLETAGALLKALPILGGEPFLLVNGDVWCDFPLQEFTQKTLPQGMLGHLLMVTNPEFKAFGDFQIGPNNLLQTRQQQQLGVTFSGISLLHPELINTYPQKRDVFALKEVFDWAIQHGTLSASQYSGCWMDIGTPQRLNDLEKHLSVA